MLGASGSIWKETVWHNMCVSLRLALCVLPAIVAAASKSSAENPAFMMMSGISSTEDLCFVVENGSFFFSFRWTPL